MARKEWTPENWKWDEEKIRKYLEEFEKNLNSKEEQDILEKRREKLRMAQELLKDEESIESLTSEKLSALLKMTDAFSGNKRPALIIEKGDEEYFKEFKAWLKSLIKINPGDQLPEKNPKDIGIAYATELLTLRNPKEFYLINNASIEGFRELGFGKLPSNDEKSYPKWRPLFDELKEKIKKIVEKNLDKEVDYYDVDNFLYFVRRQYKKSKKNKSNESQDRNKESANIAETVKESDTKNELTLHKYFQYEGFYFDQGLITAFYSALKTKGFVILSGLTGTGKTKLAQIFADLFLEEKSKESSETNDSSMNGFIIKVQHYMLQHNRMYIPTNYLHFLGSTDVKQGVKVKVVINDEEEICRLVEYTNSPVALYFNKKVAEWFKNNLKKGDQLLVKIELSEDNQVEKFILQKVETETRYFPTYTFLSVRPDWRGTKELLGYYNPINRAYESTPLLKFILEAKENYEDNENNAVPYFIILDEMNLSHVEYYFADFLSVLESGRDENYWTKETIKLHNSEKPLLDNNGEEIPKEIKLPPNLYIIGSVNIDETTYMFSPKVLDRAFTIEFREVNLDDYLSSLKNEGNNLSEEEHAELRKAILEDLRNKKNNKARFCGAVADKEEIKEALDSIKKKENTEENKERSEKSIFDKLKELNQHLQPYDLHFGYRVLDEIALFIKYATNAFNEVGKLSPENALDFAVLMKVLPKFHGPRQKLERPLWLVLGWCLKNSVKYENKTFDNLINEIWGILTDQKKRPNIEDLTNVIQGLKSELNNRSKNESKGTNPESQKIDKNQNQATEESPESTSEAHQTEQTSNTEKIPIINRVKYQRTAIKVLTMLRQLYETGFTSFA
jgi:5-methylcytosine-specific restriction endonuclease McrBC GTP-binding regulatory subunit McrB